MIFGISFLFKAAQLRRRAGENFFSARKPYEINGPCAAGPDRLRTTLFPVSLYKNIILTVQVLLKIDSASMAS